MERKLTLITLDNNGCCRNGIMNVVNVFITCPYEGGKPIMDDEAKRQLRKIVEKKNLNKYYLDF